MAGGGEGKADPLFLEVPVEEVEFERCVFTPVRP
jgi:hypothetical protein